MANFSGPTCKLARREKADLSLKSGIRSLDSKCNLEVPPGQHGSKRARTTDYGVQLRAKQKVKRIYGVLEKQFLRYFKEAARRQGSTGEQLMKILESRLDNVVYRLGFAATRRDARQLVTHGHILVNGERVNIPSYTVKPGEEITLKESSRQLERVQFAVAVAKQHTKADWVDVDLDQLKGTLTRAPELSDLPPDLNVQLIIELYSK